MVVSRIGFTFLISLFPLFAFAQGEDALQSAIRADIMSDPRSADMSPTELDALVDALASQAEEQGVAAEYLEAQNSFEETPFEAPVYEPLVTTPYDPLSLAIGAFFLVLLGVWIFLAVQRKKHRKDPPAPDTIA